VLSERPWIAGIDAVSAAPFAHIGDESGESGDVEVAESAGDGAAVEVVDQPGCSSAGIRGFAQGVDGNVDGELTGDVGESFPFDSEVGVGGTDTEGSFQDVAGSAPWRVGGGVEDGEVAAEGAVAVAEMRGGRDWPEENGELW
jgi:hypothetical protein